MSIVSAKPKKNRIYITIADTNRQELEVTIKKIEVAALALRPNFTCIADFRFAESLLIENRDLLEKGQKILSDMGIGKTVRLVTEEQTENLQFQTLDIVRSGYEIEYATTHKTAEKILDNYKREIGWTDRRPQRGNLAFKIIDQGGWEDEQYFIKYKDALKRLKHIRKSGRNNAIIVSRPATEK
jgi:hypothetical protein